MNDQTFTKPAYENVIETSDQSTFCTYIGARLRHRKRRLSGEVIGFTDLSTWDFLNERWLPARGTPDEEGEPAYAGVRMRWDNGKESVVTDTKWLIDDDVNEEFYTDDFAPWERLEGRAGEIAGGVEKLCNIKPHLESRYLIKGLIDRGASSCLYSRPGGGKTFLALELGFHVAARREWRGHRVGGQDTDENWPGPVLYVSLEGGTGVDNRIEAFRVSHPDVYAAGLEEGGMFFKLKTPLDLHSEGDAEALIDVISEIAPWFGLVVIDTLARAMGSGNENDTGDMGQFIKNCDRIRADTSAHVMVIHHTGKDGARGARGSNSLLGAVDTEIEITQEGGIISVKATKQRDMPRDFEKTFTLQSVEIGVDEDGDPVTSAVLVEAEPVATGPRLSGSQEIAMQALTDALIEHGHRKHDLSKYPARNVVAIDRWRTACDRHGLTLSEDTDSRRRTFNRAKKALMDKNLVREYDGQAWKVQDDE